MSWTAARSLGGRLFRLIRCDKSVTAARLPNPGRTPGFRRDRMQAQITFGSFRFEPATARLWDNGVEVKLTRQLSFGLEFMHTDLGRSSDINGPQVVPGAPESYGIGLRSNSITARFNYLFGQ